MALNNIVRAWRNLVAALSTVSPTNHCSDTPLGSDSSTIGRKAEQKARSYLEKNGFRIIRTNWRTKLFEIDIIAQGHTNQQIETGTIVFFEVKYRRGTDYGFPEEFIDTAKIKKVRLGAESWIQAHGDEVRFELGVISVVGDDYRIDRVIIGV